MVKKMAWKLAFTMAAAAVAVGATATGASAAESGPVGLRSVNNSQMVMDVSGGSQVPGTQVIQWTMNSGNQWYAALGPNQQWILPTNGDVDGGTGAIRNVNSGQCIETDGIAGHAVYQARCNGSALQQWRLELFHQWNWADFTIDSHFRVVNPATGLLLDVYHASQNRGASIIVWYRNGGDNQSWDVTSIS